ncbi:MAG: DUF1801 domain-containing protein [Aureispira sp.]
MMTMPATVKEVFDRYPQELKEKLVYLRSLILEVAHSLDLSEQLEETLKWGEPSFLAPKGSTIRINRIKKRPDHYAIYFKCTSKLVPHFKTLYQDTFEFENNRAIVFHIDSVLPVKALQDCIQKALTYHQIKQSL